MVPNRHATRVVNHGMCIYIAVSLVLPSVADGQANMREFPNDDPGLRMTREYHLRQGAIRGVIVKPSKYDLQEVEMFLGIPYAAPPLGNFRFMPPVSAPPWPGVKNATRFAPVCPQSLPPLKKDNPPSPGRQHYMNKLKTFLTRESEDCLYLNIYVPYREQKTKRFPVLVFIHGDSFEYGSGNSYDGRILASYGNIMVVTLNYRLGILGFMKPSLTEHVYGNNGLLDQLAALQWIKDNIQDLNGEPNSVTIMGQGTGAACVGFLMLSPISNGLFHRAILMSGSAMADWAMTKDPTPYTLQVAQNLGCNPLAKDLMACLQSKPLTEIKKVQILARQWETPLGPTVAGSFIPNEPSVTMESFPNLLSKYQLLSGVTELERYHDFGVIELDHGVLETQRDDFINKYTKLVYEGAEKPVLKEILKQYGPQKLDPQRWSVLLNRNVILDVFSDARGLAPTVQFANYHSKSNRQSYFYVFGHNSISTEFASLNRSVHGEELPYVLGVPLGGARSHFHTEYTIKEKLLSEVVMRLWTNFVKMGTPNTQSKNEYMTLDRRHWGPYNVEWPEYSVAHQSYLKLDAPPKISSFYRSNFTEFWNEYLPDKMQKYLIDPLYEYTTFRPKSTHRNTDSGRKPWTAQSSIPHTSSSNFGSYGRIKPYATNTRPGSDFLYREIQAIKVPARPVPPDIFQKPTVITQTTTVKINIEKHANLPPSLPVKTSSATITLVVSLLILFVIANIGICTLFYKKKRRQKREQSFNDRSARAENGEIDVIGRKSSKDDRNALKTFKNGYTVIKSINLKKMRKTSNKSSKKIEPCKTPKSDDSGGFRERFQLRRHLSTSTLDAHTKVKDWITNEMLHRCSPAILRQSNSELETEKNSTSKPFTRSEELLSDSKKPKRDTIKSNESLKSKAMTKSSTRTKTSEKTTSTSALGSHASIESSKNMSYNSKLIPKDKSTESIKSESTKSIKISVAIDATPSARTNSILNQEPIELSKCLTDETKHSEEPSLIATPASLEESNEETKIFTNEVTVKVDNNTILQINHKHSSSDPVTDVNYDKMMKAQYDAVLPDIPPPLTFRNDINVTSKDETSPAQPLTAEESLQIIKRRNCPKVLPDYPNAQKRLSLQPTSLRSFRASNSFDSTFERTKIPPQPPPRTSTLERRKAYRNTKPLSSFDATNIKKINENEVVQNYENINALSPSIISAASTSRSFDSSTSFDNSENFFVNQREIPKVIIPPTALNIEELKSHKATSVDTSLEIPRVRLPDDFHSPVTGSMTSFSSFYSDEGIDENDEDITEDKLIQELVGGVESPTELDNILDTKGPETIYERKLEIVPVKINTDTPILIKENYVCISDLQFRNISDLDQTAQIKSNFRVNKLQSRSESINKPREKSIQIKQKKSKKPSILGKGLKSSRKTISKPKEDLEHSTSGSSNDTESSTGTVKKVEVKRDSNYN